MNQPFISRFTFALLLVLGITSFSRGQSNIGKIKPNPYFGNNGSQELDFGFQDEPSAFATSVVKQTSIPLKILVGIKAHRSGQDAISFGLERFTYDGWPDSSFGTNGIFLWDWNTVSYANYIINRDSTAIGVCGYSGTSSIVGEGAPSVFLFTPSGGPDSSFGGDGHAVYKYSDGSGGEFNYLKFIDNGYLVAFGYTSASISGGQSGFGAMWFKQDGTLDSSYGINGQIQIAAAIERGTGYFLPDHRYMFIGVSTNKVNPSILLARLTKNGRPDSSFGINGLLNTGIQVSSGADLSTGVIEKLFQYGRIMVAANFNDGSGLPFSLLRIDPNTGAPDSSYGTLGYSSAPIISNIHQKGIILSNDGSCLIAGQADSGLGITAIAKFLFGGGIDMSFADGGIYLHDFTNGTRTNSFTYYNGIGEKKFACVGTIGVGLGSNILLGGYIQANDVSVSPRPIASGTISITPNPARSFVTITAPETISSLEVFDVQGKTVISFDGSKRSSSSYYLLDVSALPAGTYHCSVKTVNGYYNQGFVVTR